MGVKYVYFFGNGHAEGDGSNKEFVRGKGCWTG